jgi:hypothetical protein
MGARPASWSGASDPQLQQGQGVASGPLDQTVDHLGGQLETGPGEQGGRRLRPQPLEPQLGQPVGREVAPVAVAGGEHQRHPLGLQPAGGEGQRLGRGPVQPLSLVDQPQHRPVLGRLGQQAEHRHRDQEPVLRLLPTRGAEAEGATEGLRLRPGQAPDQLQQRAEQLVQGGEGQLGLGLDPAGPQHGHPVGPPGGMVEQRRLADAGLPAHHQHPAARPTGVGEQPFQDVALGAPAVKHHRDASPGQDGQAPRRGGGGSGPPGPGRRSRRRARVARAGPGRARPGRRAGR